jgi:hypothetical protein
MKGNLFLSYTFCLLIISCNCRKSADIVFYKKEKKLDVTTPNAFIDTITICDEPEVHYDFVDKCQGEVKIYRIGKVMKNHLDLENIDSNYKVKGNLKEMWLRKAVNIKVELYIKETEDTRFDSREARFIVADTSSNKIIEKYGGGCK